MNFPWNIWSSVYRLLEFWWRSLIGIRSVTLEEANGIGFVPWISLQKGFQFWVSSPKFQVWLWFSAQLPGSSWLGLCLGFCTESIRLTNLIRISCIHDFWDLISKLYFSNIFHAILYQLRSIQSKYFYIESCTKSWGHNMHKKIEKT